MGSLKDWLDRILNTQRQGVEPSEPIPHGEIDEAKHEFHQALGRLQQTVDGLRPARQGLQELASGIRGDSDDQDGNRHNKSNRLPV